MYAMMAKQKKYTLKIQMKTRIVLKLWKKKGINRKILTIIKIYSVNAFSKHVTPKI